jgi:hypothetical protein
MAPCSMDRIGDPLFSIAGRRGPCTTIPYRHLEMAALSELVNSTLLSISTAGRQIGGVVPTRSSLGCSLRDRFSRYQVPCL